MDNIIISYLLQMSIDLFFNLHDVQNNIYAKRWSIIKKLDIYIIYRHYHMNWLSKKIILSQIKKYFFIEDEQQISIEILGDHHITCHNLRLRNTIFNQPSSKIHVQHLTINNLSISYNSTRDDPLKLILDGAKLVLAFNPQPKRQSSSTNIKDILKPFFDSINSKKMLKQRGFIAEQIYQLKNLFGEFLISKVSLLIRNVDVSVQYQHQNQIRVFGFELGEVNIKQRMVINHQGNGQDETKEEEILCSLEAVSMYLGVPLEEDQIEQLAQNRQILRKTTTIKKVYLLEKELINTYYNINKSIVSINIKELNFKSNKFISVELANIVQYLAKYLSDRPLLRPGKGEVRQIEMGDMTMKMREGTFQWWGYLFRRVLAKVQDKQQYKILSNQKYRLYLFYLFYKFTFGSNSPLQQKIKEYQFNKLPHSIMNTYNLILSRIQLIKQTPNTNEELHYFVNFLSSSQMVVDCSKRMGLKRLTYEKVKESGVFFNLKNCTEFIREFTNKTNISINIIIENRISLTVYENKLDYKLLKDGFTLDPPIFYELKSKYINKFFKNIIEEGFKQEKIILTLQIHKLMLNKNKSELKLSIPAILVQAGNNELILKINHVALLKQNKTICTQTNTIILSQKNQYLKITSIFVNIHKSIVTHFLTLKLLLSDDITKPVSQKEQFDTFLNRNIYQRLPKHPYFQNYSDQSTNIQVQKIVIVSSLFHQNQYLLVEANQLVYNCPVNSKNKVTLSNLSVSRSKISNFDKIKQSKIQKLVIEQQSLIVENSKPLKMTFDQIYRKKKENNLKYFQSVTDIVLPFLLIQISFIDIYFFMLMMNYWNQLINNRYFFPKREGRTQSEKKIIQISPLKIQYFQKFGFQTKSFRNRVQLEGIQLILYGQNRRQTSNQILSVLIEGITYTNKAYILSTKQNFSFQNIFVQNCLGKKTFNFQTLTKIIELKEQSKQPLINVYNKQEASNSLILYGMNKTKIHQQKGKDYQQSKVKGFKKPNLLEFQIKSSFSMHFLRKNSQIQIQIEPIFIYQSPDYYQILMKCFSLISAEAKKKYKPSQKIPQVINSSFAGHQILEAKNITQKIIVNCHLDRINLIVLHLLEPIYTISLLQVSIKHQTEAYVTKVQARVRQVYVVDMSINCGLHPIVFKAVPMNCYFTKYDSALLRKKQKKSALLQIYFDKSEIFFLNRKIQQLVNFIMDHFTSNQDQKEADQNINDQNNMKNQQGSYPFCFRVQFTKSILLLLRSSLSEQKMVGQIEEILIANYADSMQDVQNSNFFYDCQNNYKDESFQSCIEIQEQEIQFLSFVKEEEQKQVEQPTIYINVKNLYIFNNSKQSKSIIEVTQIAVTFIEKILQVQIPNLNLDLTQDDFQLLIRITEQNFGETPVSYLKDSILAQQKNIMKFKADYLIGKIQMAIRQNRGDNKMGELIIQNLHGQNIMYTNGQKDDNIDIQSVQYVSCLNNDLESIIVKKQILSYEEERNQFKDDVKSRIQKSNHFYQYRNQLQNTDNNQQIANKFFKNQEDRQEYKVIEEKENLQIRGQSNDSKKQETNLNRIGKWIGGMCQKCMCCCKKNHENEANAIQEQQILKKDKKQILKMQEVQPLQLNGVQDEQFNFEESNIESENEMIQFSSKINPGDQYCQLALQKQNRLKNKNKSIIMRIHSQRSKEKRLQILVRHLDIYYEKNQHLMSLINFLNKPYSGSERPSYLKQARFNNYRPFQMMVQLYNSSMFIKKKDPINQKYIQVDVKMIYNIQRKGDCKNGPGNSLMQIDLIFAVQFYDQKIDKKIPLSKNIRLLYEKESQFSYHHRQQIKNQEKLLMFGLQGDEVRFNIPVYVVNSLLQLYRNITTKKQSKKSGRQSKEQMPMEQEKMIKKDKTITINDRRLIDSKMTTNPQSKFTKSNQNSKYSKNYKSSQNPFKKEQATVLKSKTTCIYFIPILQIDIETKLETCFMKLNLGNIKYRNIQMIKDSCQNKNQVINMNVNIDYWNLNIGKFEPFLEQSKFIVTIQSNKRGNTQSNVLKVLSKSEIDHNCYDYKKGLCINLSTAFYHTFKQLQLKYLIGNQDLQSINSQVCYDLTQVNREVYQYMNMTKKISNYNIQHFSFIKKYPQQLKNFFGRDFRIDDLHELSKKKSKRSKIYTNKFHIEGLRVFLYHSFLESTTKSKNITYRTPFRIYNMLHYRIRLTFGSLIQKNDNWSHELQYKQYYSIPQNIYDYDYLVNISTIKRSLSKRQSINTHEIQQSLKRNSSSLMQSEEETISVKYLIQMQANKNEYHDMQKGKMYEKLFKLSNLQRRLIDKRDFLIKTSKFTFSLINIKTECEHLKDKYIDGSKIILYDSLTVILSPIIIYNYTIINLNLISCRQKKYQLGPNKSIQLNQFPKNVQIKDIVVEFAEDMIHKQYHFLDFNIGKKIEVMQIDRNQSINIRITKQTYNTCLVEIYPDWLIINQTDLQFQLDYDQNRFPIDKKSLSSLAIPKNKNNNTMKINLHDPLNAQQEMHKFVTETDLIDIFALVKVHQGQQIKSDKQHLHAEGCCRSFRSRRNISCADKQNSSEVFSVIQLVLKIQESPLNKLIRNLIINYKYLIVNEMEFEMSIYQSSNGQTLPSSNQEGIEILKLYPKEQKYLYTYDFLPKQIYIKINYDREVIVSNIFACDDSIGRSLSIKMKKSNQQDIHVSNIVAYHQNFHYVRIDSSQKKYTTILNFNLIDDKKVKHPFYINNVTNYFVKITENGESFKIRPKTKVPFAWSNLINNTHQVEVQIEGVSKVYSLKQKSQFEPISIKGSSNNYGKKNSKSDNHALFKREKCFLTWQGKSGSFLMILDIFAKKLYINIGQGITLNMTQAERVSHSHNKIEIYFKNKSILEFHPQQSTYKEWLDILVKDIDNDIVDRIFFTIESFQNSIIFFLHNIDITLENDAKIDRKQYIVENFFISIINSSPIKTEEVLLINMENIECIIQNRVSKIKADIEQIGQRQAQIYFIKKFEQTLRIKKMKINNQLNYALNPVILSQIKKSNNPFLQLKREKQNITLNEIEDLKSQQQIEHYKSCIFFLDEAELMIEAALIPQILNLKKGINQIDNQYSQQMQSELSDKPQLQMNGKVVKNQQIYIDFLEIKPIKMTISVSFDSNIDKQFEPKLMSFLTLIPAGVQNAIITIDSYIFHHVFLQENRLRHTLHEYYLYQMKKQILYNSGSIQILAPLQLVKGLGIGVKSIFYNPFYEFVQSKEIKNFTSTFVEGLISFFVFVFSMGFLFLNGYFKFIAFFSFDRNFQSRRQMFRKQIFKSPLAGFTNGGRYLFRIVREYFINFITWPCEYNTSFPCLGLLFGFILAFLNIFPWLIKIIVTVYDFMYVIGLGFISWGYYEQNSMKERSRPIRTFPHKQLYEYDFLTAKGNEIMRKNLIEENDSEQISFISHIEEGEQSKYLVLSNYRILYCSHQLASIKEIQLYRISRIVVGQIKKGSSNTFENLFIIVELSIPDKGRCLCFQSTVNNYEIKFKDLATLKNFIATIKINLQKQELQYQLEDINIAKYEKKITQLSNL